MNYDKKILNEWCKMDSLEDHVDKFLAEYDQTGKSPIGDESFGDKFDSIKEGYYKELSKRIGYCEELLKHYDDSLIYYTLAELYNREFNYESIRKKAPVRYYAIKAIRRNRQHAPSWALLADAYASLPEITSPDPTAIALLMEKTASYRLSILKKNESFQRMQKSHLRYVDNAIICINKAVALQPSNEEYVKRQFCIQQMRNAIASGIYYK